MSNYKAVKCSGQTDITSSKEVNHNEEISNKKKNYTKHELQPLYDTSHSRSYTKETIQLPNDGRVEIVASRRFGKHVTSSRDKDEVALTLDEDIIRIQVAAEHKSRAQNVLQSCGARIPHGPAVLDIFVSGIMFVYASLLALLVSYVRNERKYLSIIILWFFYPILRINTFNTLGAHASTMKRKIWHFSGISFSTVFMYFTLIIVFPMLTRDAYYEEPTTSSDEQPASVLLIMSAMKASVGFALLGMAARRSFHCGKIISHMDIINSLLLGNVDIFNLVETLSLKDGASPIISKGSSMEISILIVCEIAFLILILEALMPYSLATLDKQNVGNVKYHISLKQSKQQAIVMVYPYSLLLQNVPFLVIRVLLFACYDTLQLAYVIKNITSIVLGIIAVIRARSSLKKKKDIPFLSTTLVQRRVSI